MQYCRSLQEDLWSTMCNILIREAGHLVSPQQTFRRVRSYGNIPSGQTASHTQMARLFRVVISKDFISFPVAA